MYQKIPWDLIVSKLNGRLKKQEQQKFDSWLSSDDNEILFAKLEIVWQNIQKKTSSYEPDMEYYWRELSSRIERIELNEESFQVSENKTFQFTFKNFYRIAALAVLLLLGSFYGFYFWGKSSNNYSAITQTYTSASGKSRITLPEGTVVWMHSNTILSYNYNYKTKEREVNMQGEAYFDVKKNEKNPFVVYSDGVAVKVLGTKFNISSYEKESNVIVSLIEGSVSMSSGDEQILLKPGEEGSLDKKNRKLTLNKTDEEFVKSWTEEQLRFENKNLRYVCRYLEKWYSTKIEIDPKIPNDQYYTFTLRNEKLEDIVRIMSKMNAFNYQFDENNKLIIKK